MQSAFYYEKVTFSTQEDTGLNITSCIKFDLPNLSI